MLLLFQQFPLQIKYMKKSCIYWTLSISLVLGCKSSYVESKISKVTLIGEAMQDKPGAFIMVPQKGMVFIDKLDEWPEECYGKKIEATGKLYIYKRNSPKSNDSITIQESVGTYQVLKKAKWKMIK
jgi:hypothetical protein